ncbi:MAG: hypothetical protein ACK55Z_17335, partial [bacterium]
MGGGPLNNGVIQLPYAGTGRESRTISGPRAAADRNQRGVGEAGSRLKWERARTGPGRSLRSGLEEGCLR